VPAETRTRVLRMKAFCAALADTRATQIAEFAVALPLLLVMVVGIFDFGNAYNLKQKVTNTAREAARLGASQPTNDLSDARRHRYGLFATWFRTLCNPARSMTADLVRRRLRRQAPLLHGSGRSPFPAEPREILC